MSLPSSDSQNRKRIPTEQNAHTSDAYQPLYLRNRQASASNASAHPHGSEQGHRDRAPSRISPEAARRRAEALARRRRRQTMIGTVIALLLILTIAIIIGVSANNASSVVIPSTEESAQTTPDIIETLPVIAPTDTSEPPIEPNGILVVIDPGHGSTDGGTTSDYLSPLLEKDINLQVALKLRDALVREGYTVLMTRTADTPDPEYGNFLELEERVAILTKAKPDYFISLHCDSFTNESVSGTRVYHQTNTPDAPALAQSIADGIYQQLQPSKQLTIIDNRDLMVLRHTVCPAILIEMGFVTNQTDAKNLANETWQSQFVLGIVNGLNDHAGQ